MAPLRISLALAALLLSGCGRDKVMETHPQGKPKLIRSYAWFGGEKPANLTRERSFFFNGNLEADSRYKHGVREGLYLDFWHNGQKKSRGHYQAGKKQGDWEFHFNQFTVSAKGKFKDDMREGPWNLFWENGGLRAQGEYRAGRETGTWREWNAQGVLTLENSCFPANDTGSYLSLHANRTPKQEYRCRQGKPFGIFLAKDPEGEVSEKGDYDSLGRKQGFWETFHAGGGRASLRRYLAGLEDDSAFAWFASGNFKERGFFTAGLGEILVYDSLGRISERRHYAGGRPEGEWWTYYPFSGARKSLVSYWEGLPGEMTAWHPNGKLRTGGLYLDGKKTGEWKALDERGALRELSAYREGMLHGERIFYDSLGRKVRSQRYEYGYPAEGTVPAHP